MTLNPGNLGQPLGIQDQDYPLLRDVPLVGGLNNRVAPRWIHEHQAAVLENVDLCNPTQPKKRDGFSRIPAGTAGMRSSALRISALAYFEVNVTSRLLVAAVSDPDDGAVYFVNPDSTTGWAEAKVADDSSGAVSPLQSYNVATDNARMFQANDLLWIVPDTSQEPAVMKTDGTLIRTGAANKSPPLGAVDGAFMLERVWLLAKSKLYWSKVLPSATDLTPTPTAFNQTTSSAAGGFLVLSPDRGGTDVACRPWKNVAMMCFFTGHIEAVFVDSSNPLLSARQVVEKEFGCGARDSIISIGDEMFFLDQYREFRALRFNQFNTVQGVIPDPVSEPCKAELTDRMNPLAAHKTKSRLFGQYIYVFYARDTSDEPNAAMIYDTSKKFWFGPYLWGRPLTNPIISDIRNKGFQMFTSDASSDDPRSLVYDMFDGSFSDDGTGYTYVERSKAHTAGRPEADKSPVYLDFEFTGSKGASGEVYMRTSELDDFTKVARKAVDTTGTSSFPLVFPLVDEDTQPVGGKLFLKSTAASPGITNPSTLSITCGGGNGADWSEHNSGDGAVMGGASGTATTDSITVSTLGTEGLMFIGPTFAEGPTGAVTAQLEITAVTGGGASFQPICCHVVRINSANELEEVQSSPLTEDDTSAVTGATTKTWAGTLSAWSAWNSGDKLGMNFSVKDTGGGGATTLTFEIDGSSSFLSGTFPAAVDPFPLTEVTPKVTTRKVVLDSEYGTEDVPLYTSDLPLDDEDLPLIDAGGGPERGRVLQWEVRNSDNGEQFERIGVRVAYKIHNVDKEREP